MVWIMAQPASAPPGTADDLRNKRKRCLGGAEVVDIQAHVRVDDADKRNGWEIKARGDHLRAKQNGDLLFAEFFFSIASCPPAAGTYRRPCAEPPCRGNKAFSSCSIFCVPLPMAFIAPPHFHSAHVRAW